MLQKTKSPHLKSQQFVILLQPFQEGFQTTYKNAKLIASEEIEILSFDV